jgi:hypothetical protein
MYKLAILLILVTFLLSACSSPSVSSEEILKVGITPNLTYFQSDIYDCAAETPGYIQITVLPLETLSYQDFAMIIHSGQAPEGTAFTTQIGSTELIFILNTENPVSTIKLTELADILMGNSSDWQDVAPSVFSESTPINVWSYPSGDDVRGQIEGLLLNGRPMTINSRIAPDGEAMVTAIMDDPNAIGYILYGTSHAGVTVTQVVLADKSSISLPVLASLPKLPEGAVADLLVCVSQSME